MPSSDSTSHITASTLMLLVALAMVTFSAAPAESARPPSRVSLIRQLNYLKSKLPCQTDKDRPARLTATQVVNRMTRRRNLFKKIVTTCGPYLKRTCSGIASRCHSSILAKRSIPDQENAALSRGKRAVARRGRRRPNRRMRIEVNCDVCKRSCWD